MALGCEKPDRTLDAPQDGRRPLVRLHSRLIHRGRSVIMWLGRLALVAVIGFLYSVALAPPADAHGGDETQEGYVLVQQALGQLAMDTGPAGIDLAMEKVDDTLAAKDQDGVEVASVEEAKRALEGDEVGRARALLQGSIKVALAEQAPAVGEQTGTTVVSPALPGRYDLSRRDWVFLVASLIALFAGIGLAFYFRPSDTVGALRQRLGVSPIANRDTAEPTHLARGK